MAVTSSVVKSQEKEAGVPEEHPKTSDIMAYHYITTASSDSRLLQVRLCVVARDSMLSMFFVILLILHAIDESSLDYLEAHCWRLKYSILEDFTTSPLVGRQTHRCELPSRCSMPMSCTRRRCRSCYEEKSYADSNTRNNGVRSSHGVTRRNLDRTLPETPSPSRIDSLRRNRRRKNSDSDYTSLPWDPKLMYSAPKPQSIRGLTCEATQR